MEREGLKDAAARKARLRMLLGCGKELSRGGKNLNKAGKTKIIHDLNTPGSERKFGNSVMRIPGNLDVELGTDRGKVLKSEIDLT